MLIGICSVVYDVVMRRFINVSHKYSKGTLHWLMRYKPGNGWIDVVSNIIVAFIVCIVTYVVSVLLDIRVIFWIGITLSAFMSIILKVCYHWYLQTPKCVLRA